MPTKSHTTRTAIASALSLAAACLSASPALAGSPSGSIYNPQTNTTTTIIRGPGRDLRSVEIGNTLARHRFDGPIPRVTRPMSGALYDPETRTTTTIVRRPGVSVTVVRPGNLLGGF